MVSVKVYFPEKVDIDINSLPEPISESLQAFGGIPEFDVTEEFKATLPFSVEIEIGYIATDLQKIIFGRQVEDLATLLKPFSENNDFINLWWKDEVASPDDLLRDHSYLMTSVGLMRKKYRMIDEESFPMTEGKGTFIIMPVKVAGKD